MAGRRWIDDVDAAIAAHSFSGVVSIRRGDDLLMERAVGYADRSNRMANTLDTRFGIASGTKFLTALAIGTLIAEGRITLSTLLRDCLKVEFPRYAPNITIEHLLTHTSGIPDYFDEEKVANVEQFSVGRPWYELRGPRDYLPVFPDEPMKFEPGARFSYSNGGFILLGVIVEELTGGSFRQCVEERLLRPIGITRSGFYSFDRLPENTALGYIDEEQGWRTNIYSLPIIGASDGGMYFTAPDLVTLWRAFWAGEILPMELVGQFATPWVCVNSERSSTQYGLGLWIQMEPGARPIHYIEGSDAGVSFRSRCARDTQLVTTVISNTTRGAWPLLRAIAAALRSEGLE